MKLYVWCRTKTGDWLTQVDGGDPMQLTGEIVLCSRDNVTQDRHFSGSLAHLSLFNTTLTPQHISALYAVVPANSTAAQAALGLGSSAVLDKFNTSSFLQVRRSP